LAKCIYDEQDQEKEIANLADKTLEQDINRVDMAHDLGRPRTINVFGTGGDDFVVELARLAPRIKYNTFREGFLMHGVAIAVNSFSHQRCGREVAIQHVT
jgi:hypothetical protein